MEYSCPMRTTEEIREEIASRFRAAMAFRNVSSGQLSEALGGKVSRQSIWRYRSAKTDPPFCAMALIAATLGVSLEWLAYGVGEIGSSDHPWWASKKEGP